MRSTIIAADTAVVCTLTVENFEHYGKPVLHYFRQSTTTYLLPGDYRLTYQVGTKYLHSEWVHISRKQTIIYKKVLLERLPLDKVRFVKPKKPDPGIIYWEW